MININKIFKYTKAEYVESCLKNGVFASVLSGLNDPYEKKGIKDLDDYRVVCLTNSWKRMLMWSYYNNHTGVCIEYYVPDEAKKIIRKVIYQHKTYNKTLTINDIKEKLLYKGSAFKHENEYRSIYHKNDKNKLWKKVKNNIFLELKVKKIILGCEISTDVQKKIISIVSEYNKNNTDKVVISKLKLADTKHMLIVDKKFYDLYNKDYTKK